MNLSRLLFSIFLASASFVPVKAAELSIVAAENFYGGVAQQIAGPDARVTSILTNPNQDPHEFTTNAETARAVADADIVIYSGIGYDTWIERLLGTQATRARVVINVAELIHAHDGDNPHIWYAPGTMPALAQRLTEELSRIAPEHAAAYRRRLTDFQASMQPEMDQIVRIRSLAGGLKVTATEPVFGYMAGALGFQMLNYNFQVKVMNDAEPSADETEAFEKSLKGREAKILFYNSQVTDPTTTRIQKIAREFGVPIVGVTETQPPLEKSYVDWMLNELDGVQAALPAKN